MEKLVIVLIWCLGTFVIVKAADAGNYERGMVGMGRDGVGPR